MLLKIKDRCYIIAEVYKSWHWDRRQIHHGNSFTNIT